jgi:SAM-dependent methyltransferase
MLKQLAIKEKGGQFERGCSIGCGFGQKEIDLVRAGIVGQFDLFEISDQRMAAARKLAEAGGVSDRVNCFEIDVFSSDWPVFYDLAYWSNSLHHMLNTKDAVQWSYDHLVDGGWFAMDDYVGPSRFQWSERNLAMANSVRESLPKKYLIDYRDSSKMLPIKIMRPLLESMLSTDPTEAADSDNIIPSIKRFFPHCKITLTGGCIYHLPLNDVLVNFQDDSPEDQALLKSLLLVDEAMCYSGETHYAVAFAVKQSLDNQIVR